MKKITYVFYSPYDSIVRFKTALSEDSEIKEINSESRLSKYSNIHVLFSNCVNDIVNIINEDHNTTAEGLEIRFSGPESDFKILQLASLDKENGAGGKISCRHIENYIPVDEAIEKIIKCYNKIETEFSDYMPGQNKYVSVGKSIGDSISCFNEITSREIPICVIGTYSVGKSALINSFIGEEILPSKEDPSTAKNAKIEKSDYYWIEFDYKSSSSEEKTVMRFKLSAGNLHLEKANGPDAEFAQAIADSIMKKVGSPEKTDSLLMHDILDYFNGPYDTEIMKNIMFNVSVGVPFAKSVLSDIDERIVFYDTPGSNNASVDQQAHKEALKELMQGQTNALPILVTTRDNVMSEDVAELKKMLDDYSENFSCTNCLIVCSKGDELVLSQLQQDFKPQIKDWHGGTAILFASPIAAIGERKKDKNVWLDSNYQELYQRWQTNMNLKRITLPDYNIIPCVNREVLINQRKEDAEYDTGIPSVELEILYYIHNYANYRKCVRGKYALEGAIESVKAELKEEARKEKEAIEEGKIRKEKKMTELHNELNSIQVGNLMEEANGIEERYRNILDAYIAGISDFMSITYDGLPNDSPFDLDNRFNEVLKNHCQKELIDRCYLGENGIKSTIIRLAEEYAEKYIERLKSFVSANAVSLSEEGRQSLDEYIEKEIKVPQFGEIKSIIENINDLFEKVALIKFGLSKNISKDKEKAKKDYLDSKKKAFEKKLIGTEGILAKAGKFRTTAIEAPMNEYFALLKKWAEEYRQNIHNELEKSNMVLSGMEKEIQQKKETVADLTERLEKIKDVENELSTILNIFEL